MEELGDSIAYRLVTRGSGKIPSTERAKRIFPDEQRHSSEILLRA
jgi:hypothetical protein